MSKLNLDRDKVDLCRKLAKDVVLPVQKFISQHSTISVERTILRLLGVDQAISAKKKGMATQEQCPLVNVLVDQLEPEKLAIGVAYWFGRALCAFPDLTPEKLALKLASGEISFDRLPVIPEAEIEECVKTLALDRLALIHEKKNDREKKSKKLRGKKPLAYIIVATGNIFEDVVQAKSAAKMGADIIAVIRSTAQSLLDYVPHGATTEGFGGTYATQENFKIMRQALDETGNELGRYIALTNYSSGLCMSEIAAMASFERVDYLLNDAMYGVLFRDINMERTFIDQFFSRLICSFSGITIQTGEDNYLTTADSHRYWYQVLTSHFLNEEFAKQAGLSESKIGLGHAFEINPFIEDSLLFEIGQAQLVREIFPKSPIKYMPPTKHKQGDVFFSHVLDSFFNLTGILTDQQIILLGMLTEAIHNPFMQDRFLSLKSAKYVFHSAKDFSSEINFQPNGKIVRRARHVLDETMRTLRKIKAIGLMESIERGVFGNISRRRDGGKGRDGVFRKDRDYWNPFLDLLDSKIHLPHRQRRDRKGQSYGAYGTQQGRKSGRKTSQGSYRSSNKGQDRYPRRPSSGRRPYGSQRQREEVQTTPPPIRQEKRRETKPEAPVSVQRPIESKSGEPLRRRNLDVKKNEPKAAEDKKPVQQAAPAPRRNLKPVVYRPPRQNSEVKKEIKEEKKIESETISSETQDDSQE